MPARSFQVLARARNRIFSRCSWKMLIEDFHFLWAWSLNKYLPMDVRRGGCDTLTVCWMLMYVSLSLRWGLGANYDCTEHTCIGSHHLALIRKFIMLFALLLKLCWRIFWICWTDDYFCRDFVILNDRVIDFQVNDKNTYMHIWACTHLALGSRVSLYRRTILDFYLGSAWFKSQSEHRLFWLKFHVMFLSALG
jgi:hypothetical protein